MAGFRDLTDVDLEHQVAALSKELTALKKAVAKRGGGYYDDGREMAMDAYSEIADRISQSLPALRKRARAVESTARENPAATVAVGDVVLGLLATLAFNRR
jgi:ElaB/YqjD/DUF883 family membrane-anchored ribosome-binding protein